MYFDDQGDHYWEKKKHEQSGDRGFVWKVFYGKCVLSLFQDTEGTQKIVARSSICWFRMSKSHTCTIKKRRNVQYMWIKNWKWCFQRSPLFYLFCFSPRLFPNILMFFFLKIQLVKDPCWINKIPMIFIGLTTHIPKFWGPILN